MIKAKELADPNSCMSRASDDEMTFVLLARDVCAPAVIRFWARERVRLKKNKANDPQIIEAMWCATDMEIQRSRTTRKAALLEAAAVAMTLQDCDGAKISFELENLAKEEQVMTTDVTRCEVCGWPLASSAKDGCVPGDCSQRPEPRQWAKTRPDALLMAARGTNTTWRWRQRGDAFTEEINKANAEIARLRGLLDRSWVHIGNDNWAVCDSDGLWSIRRRLAFPFTLPIGRRYATLEDLLAAFESAEKEPKP